MTGTNDDHNKIRNDRKYNNDNSNKNNTTNSDSNDNDNKMTTITVTITRAVTITVTSVTAKVAITTPLTRSMTPKAHWHEQLYESQLNSKSHHLHSTTWIFKQGNLMR